MSKATMLGAALFATLGCGGRSAPEADAPQAPASEAPISDSAPGEPTSTETVVTNEASAPRGKRAPCVFGQDQTCNGDASVSALWGKCTESGTCECHAGFELAPTGYCQPVH